jgi:ethanolamine ammonia-lyase small subunit
MVSDATTTEGAVMTEPSSGPHAESTSADDDATSSEPTAADSVELDVDEEKVEAWDAVKNDYQVEPEGGPTPNSMDTKGVNEPDASPEP